MIREKDNIRLGQDVLDKISKLPKPNRYYIYSAFWLCITILCNISFTGILVLLVLLLTECVDDVNAVLVGCAFPVLCIFLLGVSAISRRLYIDKICCWKRANYPNTYEKEGGINVVYQEEIKHIVDSVYNKWEDNLVSEDVLLNKLHDWEKTFVELECGRMYPTMGKGILKEMKKIKIPLYYYNNCYTKDDYLDIILGCGISDYQSTLNNVIFPSNVAYDIKELVSKIECDIIDKKGVGNVRYYTVLRDSSHYVVFLYKYSSEDDIMDICTPDFLHDLMPLGRVSVVAIHKEYSKDDFRRRCLGIKNKVIFDNRLPCIQKELTKWNKLCGYPYYYFYNYYPNSVNVSAFKHCYRHNSIKDTIFKFKDSSPSKRQYNHEYRTAYGEIIDIVARKIISVLDIESSSLQGKTQSSGGEVMGSIFKIEAFGGKPNFEDWNSVFGSVFFVCIPSNSEIVNECRLKEFSNEVCYKTGMNDAFRYVKGYGDNVPKHLGGKGLSGVLLDKKYFAGKNVVIFDDIVTSGNTMSKMITALEACGANILFIVSIARTQHNVSEYHPIDFDDVFVDKYFYHDGRNKF